MQNCAAARLPAIKQLQVFNFKHNMQGNETRGGCLTAPICELSAGRYNVLNTLPSVYYRGVRDAPPRASSTVNQHQRQKHMATKALQVAAGSGPEWEIGPDLPDYSPQQTDQTSIAVVQQSLPQSNYSDAEFGEQFRR